MADDMPRLLSLLSHELRGPLGVIHGYLRLITHMNEPLSDQARECIETATRASDKLAAILNEASFLAHVRRGDLSFAHESVRLTTVVNAAIGAAELPEGSTRDVTPRPDLTLDGDEVRLRTAMTSFIAAVARAYPSPVTIGVNVLDGSGRPDAVNIRITSNSSEGSEIKEGDLNTLRGGMGLALPVASAIIAAHGGRVSELYTGERTAGFIVTLPIQRT